MDRFGDIRRGCFYQFFWTSYSVITYEWLIIHCNHYNYPCRVWNRIYVANWSCCQCSSANFFGASSCISDFKFRGCHATFKA